MISRSSPPGEISVEDEIELRWGKKPKSPEFYPKDGAPENLILPFGDQDEDRGPKSSPVGINTLTS